MGMAFKVTINTEQLDMIAAQLDGMDDLIAEMGSSAVDDFAEMAAPIETGNLVSSLSIFLQGHYWLNIAKAGYSFFVEMGTKFMAAQSFFRVAIPAINWIEIVARAARMIGL